VLAPTEWLQRAWQHGMRDPAKLASFFDVSEALIKVRLHQTGLATPRLRGYPRRAYTRSVAWVRADATLSGKRTKQQFAGVRSCA
jgi:Zn-dependent peptidase ImmA (M78 family)